MNRPTHVDFVKKALSDPAVKSEYDQLMLDYEIVSEFIRARKHANKTQDEVAELMKTTGSVISRIESCGGKNHHSPTLATLRKYAGAIGYKLEVKLIPIR